MQLAAEDPPHAADRLAEMGLLWVGRRHLNAHTEDLCLRALCQRRDVVDVHVVGIAALGRLVD